MWYKPTKGFYQGMDSQHPTEYSRRILQSSNRLESEVIMAIPHIVFKGEAYKYNMRSSSGRRKAVDGEDW